MEVRTGPQCWTVKMVCRRAHGRMPVRRTELSLGRSKTNPQHQWAARFVKTKPIPYQSLATSPRAVDPEFGLQSRPVHVNLSPLSIEAFCVMYQLARLCSDPGDQRSPWHGEQKGDAVTTDTLDGHRLIGCCESHKLAIIVANAGGAVREQARVRTGSSC